MFSSNCSTSAFLSAVSGSSGRRGRPPKQAVEIHRVLHARNTQSAHDTLGGFSDALLLLASESRVALLPCGINLVAGGRSAIGEGQNRADGAAIERRMQLLRSAHQHLEADFFLRVFSPLTTFTAADDGFGAAVPARAPTGPVRLHRRRPTQRSRRSSSDRSPRRRSR